jgi:hypothetical protein
MEPLPCSGREMGGYTRDVSGQRHGSHVPAATDTNATIEDLCFLCGPCRDVKSKGQGPSESRVEAGSNTSTVTLRVVGGDRKGSLECETVKYGRESHETRTRKWLIWRGPATIVNERPSSLQRERPTAKNPQLSDSNKNLVVSPRWVLDTKTDWPTDRRS